MESTPTLSILVPTLPSRAAFLRRLRSILAPQIAARPAGEVELLTLLDDGAASVGQKRNQLVRMARGEYVVFVDDDDRVSDDYVATLLAGCQMGVDAVCLQGKYRFTGSPHIDDFVDEPYANVGMVTSGGHTIYFRGAQHLDAIRRTIAMTVPFPEIRVDEDRLWTRSLHLSGLIKSWHIVDHPVYFYDDLIPKPAATSPRLAIVMPCFNHADVTFHCVESLMESTLEKDFKLILVDDGSTDETPRIFKVLQARWPNHIVLRANAANLGVNASWNVGLITAYALNAEHVAIVNNDLVFTVGWEQPLLQSLSDPSVGLVSPMSTEGAVVPPDWPRGADRHVNPAGYMGYMPILGACFMARLELFDRIGLFPEQMRVYFGDNWVVLATQSVGLQCGYDGESYIHHLFCVTTSGLQNDDLWKTDGPAFEALEAKYGFHMYPFAPPPPGTDPIRPNVESVGVGA